MELYLIRHGETIDNAAMIMQGQRQGELTERGRAQIDALAVSLSGIHFDAIVSSDLKRSWDSAQIISRRLCQEQGSLEALSVRSTPLLRERDWGDFTGRYIPDLKELPLPANVETMEHLLCRAASFLEWIRCEYVGGTVIAVGHGIVNKAIQAVHYGKQTCDIPRMLNAECRVLL